MIQSIILLIGPSLLSYLSYQNFIKDAHILIKIIASIFVFAVSFVVILIALIAVGAISFQR
jgi:hypothetical protein